MVGSDAAPAGRFRKPALGRPRDPPGRHYDRSAGSRLDWDRLTSGNIRAGGVSGSADLGQNRRDGAPAGVRLFARASPPKGGPKTKRCPALRPLRVIRRGNQKTGSPGPPTTGAMTLACS